MTRHTYSVHYVHAISPRDTDTHADITLDDSAFESRKTLAKALRDAGVLVTGSTVEDYRKAIGYTGYTVFPNLRRSGWHCVKLARTDLHQGQVVWETTA